MATSLLGAVAIVLSWAHFGLVHSLLARARVKRGAERFFGPVFLAGWYRGVYSLVSFGVILWVWMLPGRLPGDIPIFALPAPLRPLPFLVKGGAVALIAVAFRQIDFGEFLGTGQFLRWWREETRGATPTLPGAFPMVQAEEPLARREVYLWVRHPLNTAAFLWIWAQPAYSLYDLVFAAALTAYILIANRFEERDLVRRYGAGYLRYREVVPAFFSGFRDFGRRRAALEHQEDAHPKS